MQTLYIRPIGFAESPQSDEGGTIRLAGGLVHAARFALIVREGARIVSRQRFSAGEAGAVLGALPDALAAEAAAQWADLQASHAPLICGARTLRLDQPHVMGILNVTPDSFSDGGKFLDKPDAALEHASAMLDSVPSSPNSPPAAQPYPSTAAARS